MTVRTLKSAPGTLELYARAALPLIPGASLLPFIAGRGRDVPELELVLEDVRVDPEQLSRYAKVCRFSPAESLPATYLHLRAFPLHMALMSDGRFPFAAVGLVHLANEITMHRPLRLDETFKLRVCATKLSPHAKGRTFTILSKALVDEELVWEETSTMLRRGGSAQNPAARAEQGTQREPLPFVAEWKLPGDLGRSYGAVSGDRNPIHIHPYTAKLFGFPRAIAHGMWTKAACVAALSAKLGDSYTVQVSFRRPILLPADVTFAAAEQGATTSFEVRSSKNPDTIHLQGTVTP
jgi:acyl dehydratase